MDAFKQNIALSKKWSDAVELHKRHQKASVMADFTWYVQYKKEKRDKAFKVYFFTEEWNQKKAFNYFRQNLRRAREMDDESYKFR